MIGLTKYALIAALCAVIALGGWLMLERGRNAVLAAENERLTRSVQALEQQAKNSAEARDVEAARVELWRKRAADLDASIEALWTGDIQDVPLDPRIIAILDGLHGD
jgi:hypothetical protein